MTRNIAVIVGSLRKDSWNRKLAKAFIKLAPASLSLQIIEINNLPLYNQELDDQSPQPQAITDFREAIKKTDGVLFVTPEYNRSVPGVLKNAIDIGSRPYGKSVWNNKPTAIASASIGAIAGFGANHHLRQSLVFLNMPCMQQPEMYIGIVAELFNASDEIIKPETEAFLKNFISTYEKWVNTILD